jgi:hypothetical protein
LNHCYFHCVTIWICVFPSFLALFSYPCHFSLMIVVIYTDTFLCWWFS